MNANERKAKQEELIRLREEAARIEKKIRALKSELSGLPPETQQQEKK